MMELRLWKLAEFDKTIDKIIILNLSDLLYFLPKFLPMERFAFV